MRIIECSRCYSPELTERDGYVICDYCQSKFVQGIQDVPFKDTSIGMQSDVEVLLAKCEADPANRSRYINLILDLDPTNSQIQKYTTISKSGKK